MLHPHEPLGHPAEILEASPERLGLRDAFQVHAPVVEACQGLIRECRQLPNGQGRLLLDPDRVEVPVVRIASGSNHRAVGPGLAHVAHGALCSVEPGPRALSSVRVRHDWEYEHSPMP